MDSSFARFRSQLLAAARSGDVPALLASMSPSVRAFSDPTTPEDVLAHFGVTKNQPWAALVDALERGVARKGDYFVAPFVEAMPLDMNSAAVVARNVRMRSAPRPDAAVIGTLSMEVVTLDRDHLFDSMLFYRSAHPQEEAAWARVVDPDGAAGYVYGRFVWAPDQLRFVFEKVDGEWKLTGLGGGD